MSHWRFSALLAVAALALGTSAIAKGPEHGGSKGKGNDKVVEKKTVKKTTIKKSNKGRAVVFTTREHSTITEYYRVHKVKHKGLPPGIRKQLVRNGALPPGWEKNFYAFPPELNHRLPVLPVYCRRGFIGYDVVVIDTRTNIILDIIHDVVHNM
jgi:hypothetical protein